MNECLVTKLKGIVNDDTLPKFGEIVLYNESGTSQKIILALDGIVKVGLYNSGGTLLSSRDTDGGEVSIPADCYKITINSKYNIKNLYVNFKTRIVVKDLEYSPIEVIELGTNVDQSIFNIADTYKWVGLKGFKAQNNPNVRGTTSDFRNHPNASAITTIDIRESGVKGSADEFLSMVSLTTLVIKYTAITIKRSTLNTLQNRGCTVECSDGQIIEDL